MTYDLKFGELFKLRISALRVKEITQIRPMTGEVRPNRVTYRVSFDTHLTGLGGPWVGRLLICKAGAYSAIDVSRIVQRGKRVIVFGTRYRQMKPRENK